MIDIEPNPEMTRARWNRIPDWDKIVFLFSWCELLEDTVHMQRQEILSLQERLLRVESASVPKVSE
jgi:hypothetical protein